MTSTKTLIISIIISFLVLESSMLFADETATDNSGLIWQKDSVSGKTWQEALAYCENLTYAGYSDWRLPNKNEVIYLSQRTSPKGYINNGDTWTSSTSQADSTKAWYVNIHLTIELYTFKISVDKKSNTRSVRCVR